MKKILLNLQQLQELEFSNFNNPDAELAIVKLRQAIPPPILKHYDHLADHGKKVVVPVRHQVCTGCHMAIPIGAIVALMQDQSIQKCQNCGRYLFLPSEAPTAPAPVPAPRKKSGAREKLVRAA